MVIGKSKFYKREYVPAINTFNYIARKSSNTETQTEALLWVARCNQQLNNSQALKKTLSNIELDHYLNKKHEAVFFQIQAELAISKKEYTTAIQLLSKAISKTKNKTLRTKSRMYSRDLCYCIPKFVFWGTHTMKYSRIQPQYNNIK